MDLTQREQLVFYGITKWPNDSDEELSEKIDVKRSTVTAIRNKLERNRVYEKCVAPNFSRLGCKIIATRYGDFSPLAPWTKRKMHGSTEPEVFYRISTDSSRISLVAAENFTEIKRYLETAERRHGSRGYLTREGVRVVYYPFELSKILMFFDFARLLNKHYNVGFDEDILVDLKTSKPEAVKLSDTEKTVAYAITKYPTSSDRELAEKLSMTRQTINNARRKIHQNSLLKTVIFPDLNRLGFELIAFGHIKINVKTPLDEKNTEIRSRMLGEVIKEGSHYVLVSGNMEDIMLSAFNNYTDFQKVYGGLLGLYGKNDFLEEGESTIKIYPTEDIRNHMKLRCAPLMKRVLGIEKEI